MSFYYRSDKSVLARLEARRTAAAYRQNATPTEDFAARVDAIYQAYPHLDPGAIVSFAQAGFDPSDPVFQQIAEADFEQKRKGGFFDSVGDVLGGAGNLIGKPLGVIGRGLDTALGGVDESISPSIKGGVRTGFVVLESGLQELQTFVRAAGWAGVRTAERQGDTSIVNRLRNMVDPTRWDDMTRSFSEGYSEAGSSSAREALSALVNHEKVDLGSGWLPGGEVEEKVRQRAGGLALDVGNAHFGGPGAPAITPGRVIAARVVEPGEGPYKILSGLIDGGVAWFGDPAAALGAVAKGARVSSRLERAGMHLAGGELGAAREALTHAGTFAPVIDRSLQGRAAAKLGELAHLDDVVGRVSGARNTVIPDAVEEWLTKGGQHTINKIAETGNFYELWQATGKKIPVEMTTRLADAQTPQEVMDILRPALGAELREAPDFLGIKVRKANAKGARLAQAMPGFALDPGDLDDSVEQLDRWLRNAKVTPELRNRSVEKLARNGSRATFVSTMDEIMGDVADDLAERIRPRGVDSAKVRARQFTHMWNRDLEKVRTYFGDEIAENRKAVGTNVGGTVIEAESPFLYTEYLNNLVPLPEAREIRRATSRFARLVDNPFFEHTVNGLESTQTVWKKLTLMRGAYTTRVIGEEQLRMAASGGDSMFAHPLSAIAALVSDDGRIGKLIGTGRTRQADVLGEAFMRDGEALSDELRKSLNKGWAGWVDDTVFDQDFTVFRPGEEGYKRAWASALGELHRDPIARRVAEAEGNLADVKDWFWRREGRKFRNEMAASHPQLATQAGADRYLDDLWEGVQYRTGSDPILLEAVTTGKIDGAKVLEVNAAGRHRLTRDLNEYLDQVVGPEAVKGQRMLQAGAGRGQVWDNATGWAFSHLMTKPTNYLSRSQTFRQRYWDRIEEMLPYMDDATRTKALGQAESVVDAAQLKRMHLSAPATNRAITRLEDADHVAKAYALDETKKLLYDLSDKGQFFDAMRLVFPFGEAWKEVLTRWARISAENPRVLRRAQQVMTGARGSGFFHKDVNGEEVFTYPFSRQISKALIGMPIDLNGRVAGLSLMTEVLPGVGPVMQLPAAFIIPETPDWDWARNIISPYGEQDYGGGILESMLPGYAKNIRQFFEKGDPRLFANSVGASMDYLASTGEYDLSDENDVKRIAEDAKGLAKKVYLLRGMTQFGAPTSPLPQYLVNDENGDLDVAQVIMSDFHKMQEEDWDGAVDEFLNRYGTEALLLMQGKSFAVYPGLPVSKESAEWERAHGDIVKDYRAVWGFFAPKGEGDMDFQAYVRQFERGDRVSLKPEQRIALAQARVGNHIYQQAKAKVGEKPTRVEREWLAMVKERIRMEYPGFGEQVPGLPVKADTEQIVSQFRTAVADPRLRNTRQAQAASLYLRARDKALEFATAAGVKTLEAEAAAPAREWLGSVGLAISKRYPEFEEMFDIVFSREVD